MDAPSSSAIRLRSATGRWVLLSTVLGSGMALLDSTVVNVALPALGEAFDAGVSGLQWTINAYMITLASLLLLGGALGDRYGRRRIFSMGAVGFAGSSLLCGLAPSLEVLILARALQGVFGALLTPGSLALIQATFAQEDRPRAIGVWSGLSGAAAAAGPFIGGWLVEHASWRYVFLLNLPLAVLVLLSTRKVPESRLESTFLPPFDWQGALLGTMGLGSVTYALIEADAQGLSAPGVIAAAAIGVLSSVAFIVVERRAKNPMMPLDLFSSRSFAAANLITLCAYAALGGTFFYLVLYLQVVAGFRPQNAGLALLPIPVVMLLFSRWMGGFTGRAGARLPMAAGSLVAAAGLLFLARMGVSPSFLPDVFPGVLLFAIGVTGIAIPVTVTVLGSASPSRAGIASGINNAAARAASLLAVAVLPLITGLSGEEYGTALVSSFPKAMRLAALLLVLSGALSLALVRDEVRRRPHRRSSCPISAPPQEG